MNFETNVIYTSKIKGLSLELENGSNVNVTSTLRSGRTNYELFERLLCDFLNLRKAVKSDLVDDNGYKYEVKAFHDPIAYPNAPDWFHTASSSSFGPNNKGPLIKMLLEMKDYQGAFEVCKQLSYDDIDFFIYTNTREFDNTEPFKFTILRKENVLSLLNCEDPRLISRRMIMECCLQTLPII